MRRRIKDYSVSVGSSAIIIGIGLGVDITGYTDQQIVDSIRLIIDETVGLVLTSSLRKDTFILDIKSYEGSIRMVFPFSNLSVKDYEKAQKIQTTDSFTIEVDTGEVPMEVSAITDTFINALT